MANKKTTPVPVSTGIVETRSAPMPPTALKLTPKEELFAQNLAFGRYDTVTECYLAAYDSKTTTKNTVYGNASRLRTKTHIAARIVELRSIIMVKETVTRDDLIAGFQRDAENAERNGHSAAAVSARKEIGKLMDHYPAEKKHLTFDDARVNREIMEGRKRVSQATHADRPRSKPAKPKKPST